MSGAPVFADVVPVGTFLFANPLTSEQGFQITNSTGPDNGCVAPDTPVCTVLDFSDTTLTVKLDDGTTITRTPSNGFVFTPGDYVYGANLGDDPANSFLFDNSLDIVSATFTGRISSDSFLITDSDAAGNLSTFFSEGTFSVTLDLSGGPPIAGAVIDVAEVPASPVPEPAYLYVFFLLFSACALARFLSRHRFRERSRKY